VAYLALALRLTVGGVCLAALLGKLRGRQAWREFRSTLREVGVPDRMKSAVAVVLVAAEASVFALAPWPYTGAVGALIAVGLFVALTAGVANAVRRGAGATCRCFGVRGTRLGITHITRNAVLIVVALAAVTTTTMATTEAWQAAGIAVAVVGAAFAAAIVVFWEDLAAVLVGRTVS